MNSPKVGEAAKIEWMIRDKLQKVLVIESLCSEFPWDEKKFIDTLRTREYTGYVAIVDGLTVGFMVIRTDQPNIGIIKMAVQRSHQRLGVGRRMIEYIKQKYKKGWRSHIVIDVRESNLGAQLFFKSIGFRCELIVQGGFKDTGEPVYRMTCPLGD